MSISLTLTTWVTVAPSKFLGEKKASAPSFTRLFFVSKNPLCCETWENFGPDLRADEKRNTWLLDEMISDFTRTPSCRSSSTMVYMSSGWKLTLAHRLSSFGLMRDVFEVEFYWIFRCAGSVLSRYMLSLKSNIEQHQYSFHPPKVLSCWVEYIHLLDVCGFFFFPCIKLCLCV